MRALILAGGSGTRLWPVSRAEFPKQFLKIGSDRSLLQKTLERKLGLVGAKDIFVLTSRHYEHTIKEQLRQVDEQLLSNVMLEPMQKNTAPALALAIKYLIEKEGATEQDLLFVSPSDHLIAPDEAFYSLLTRAKEFARLGYLVTFGITPHFPEIAYGYIRAGEPLQEAFFVDRFVEKPDVDTAKHYLATGHYFWNSGMFLFQIGVMLEELIRFAPEIMQLLDGSYEECCSRFSLMPEISIDYAVMEKSQKSVVLPFDLVWSDVGSWDNVYEILPHDENRNAKIGEVFDVATKNSLVIADKRLIATIGLEDMLVIETADVVLIAKRGESQKIKQVVQHLKKTGRKEVNEHVTAYRPWGGYTVLDEDDRYKIKKITVNPEEQLSLQMHHHRSEHWVVVRGTAKVQIGDKIQFVHENESVYVPKGSMHRVSNPGKVPLEIIETQVGEYLAEDDITRFEDKYARIS